MLGLVVIPEVEVSVENLHAQRALVNTRGSEMNGVFVPHNIVLGEAPPRMADVAVVRTKL